LRQMDLYNLDVIIGVGYRVNSMRGTQFRIWATQVLRESNPNQKDILTKVVVNLIKDRK